MIGSGRLHVAVWIDAFDRQWGPTLAGSGHLSGGVAPEWIRGHNGRDARCLGAVGMDEVDQWLGEFLHPRWAVGYI